MSRSLKGVDEEIEIEDEMEEEMKAASKSPSAEGQEEHKAMYTKDNRPCLNLKGNPSGSDSTTDNLNKMQKSLSTSMNEEDLIMGGVLKSKSSKEEPGRKSSTKIMMFAK